MVALKGQIGPEGGIGVTFGIPFGSTSTSTTVGRRIAIREFANRDEPETADLGRKARRYRVDAVLLGDDYIQQFNDLVTELEKPGRKRLRHPLHGDRIVRVPEQEITVSMTSSGRCDISFDLVEAGPKDPFLFVAIDLRTPTAAARAARDADAAERMSLASKISEFANTLLKKVSEANSTLRGAKNAINARLIVVDDLAHQIDQLDDNFQDLLDTPGQIANSFGNLARQIFELAGTVTDATLSPILAVFDAAEEMAEFGDDDPDFNANEAEPNQTVERMEYGESLQAIFDMVTASATIELVGVLTDLDFDSANQVRDMRSKLKVMIDKSLASPTMTTDLTQALGQMWSAAEDFMSSRAQELPNIVLHKVAETKSAILLAQELYGDPNRADEIVNRNRDIISNPSFVPGGVVIEVSGV